MSLFALFMRKTLFETIDLHENILLDTNIFFGGHNFLRENDSSRFSTGEFKRINYFHERLTDLVLSERISTTIGVKYEINSRKISSNLNQMVFNLLLSKKRILSEKSEIEKILPTYRRLIKAISELKPIEHFKFEKIAELLETINLYSDKNRRNSNSYGKVISQTDLSLYLTAYSNSVPLISQDSDLFHIDDWVKGNLKHKKDFNFYSPIFETGDLEQKLYKLR